MREIIGFLLITFASTVLPSTYEREVLTTGSPINLANEVAVIVTTVTLPTTTTASYREPAHAVEAKQRLSKEIETERLRRQDTNSATNSADAIKDRAVQREQIERKNRDILHSKSRGTTTGPALWKPN